MASGRRAEVRSIHLNDEVTVEQELDSLLRLIPGLTHSGEEHNGGEDDTPLQLIHERQFLEQATPRAKLLRHPESLIRLILYTNRIVETPENRAVMLQEIGRNPVLWRDESKEARDYYADVLAGLANMDASGSSLLLLDAYHKGVPISLHTVLFAYRGEIPEIRALFRKQLASLLNKTIDKNDDIEVHLRTLRKAGRRMVSEPNEY